MNQILTEIGKGNERICYLHPSDPNKIIKVPYAGGSYRNQNQIEKIYFKFLEKENINFSHLARCFEWYRTMEGNGLVFEKISNYDGSKIQTLEDILKTQRYSRSFFDPLIDELATYLAQNNIVFADISMSNILCQKISNSSYRLVIIDGLGSRHLGFKFWLTCHVMMYRKYRTAHQIKKFIKIYNSYFV